jgi:hypothetical protein
MGGSMGFDLSGFRSALPKIEKESVTSGMWRLHEAHLLSGTRFSNRLGVQAPYHELWIKLIKIKHSTKKPTYFCLHNYLSTVRNGEISDCGRIISAFTGSVETALKMSYLVNVGKGIAEAINTNEVYASVTFDIRAKLGSKLSKFEIVPNVPADQIVPDTALSDKFLLWSKVKATWSDSFYAPLVLSDRKRSGLYTESESDVPSEDDFVPPTPDEETSYETGDE